MRMFTTIRSAGLCGGALCLLLSAPAQAQTPYTQRAAWLSALSGVTQNYGFEGLAAAFEPNATMSFAPGLTVSLSGALGGGRGVYVNWPGWTIGDGSSILTGPHDGVRTTTFTLSSPTTAIGSDINFILGQSGGAFLTAGDLTLTLMNGGNPVGGPLGLSVTEGFFGVTSPISFDAIQIDANATLIDGYLAFDNVTVGNAGGAAAPEPGALCLMALGLGAAVLARRRRVPVAAL